VKKLAQLWKKSSAFFFQTFIYFSLGAIFFGIAFYKFKNNLTEWKGTAAESRALNQPCSQLWQYYDDHDIWHFFSAVALFFFFLVCKCTLKVYLIQIILPEKADLI
jgi:predicted membrane channel-forming protein YqfA (hemolysin III family)